MAVHPPRPEAQEGAVTSPHPPLRPAELRAASVPRNPLARGSVTAAGGRLRLPPEAQKRGVRASLAGFVGGAGSGPPAPSL